MDDIQKKKNYLNQWFYLELDFNMALEEAKYWRDKSIAVRCSCIEPTGIKSTNKKTSPSDKFLELCDYCEEQAVKVYQLRREIEDAINLISVPHYKEILKLKHLQRYTFSEIAKRLKYSKNHTKKIYRRAIELFEIPKR